MSMPILGHYDRAEAAYYGPSGLPQVGPQHPSQQTPDVDHKPEQGYRVANTQSDSRILPPSASLAPLHTPVYSSSPTTNLPTSYHRQQYAPINNQSSNMVFSDPQANSYTPSHHSGGVYSAGSESFSWSSESSLSNASAGTPEGSNAGVLYRPPIYTQTSPLTSLPPSHDGYQRPMYGYTSNPYSHNVQQYQNYVHQAGSIANNSGRQSFSIPQSAVTPTYSRYSHPPTPISARDVSSMYGQLPHASAPLHTPRQGLAAPYQSTPIEQKPDNISPRSAAHTTAAPGPIPASDVKIVTEDGVDWMMFWYSKDKNRKQYKIRCDIEDIDLNEISYDFKKANCVYPKAFDGPALDARNRLNYEKECNETAWRLAHLNPELVENRGVTQRAVDSYRNTHANTKKRSRRIRREEKKKKRAQAQHQMQASAQSVIQQGRLALPLPDNLKDDSLLMRYPKAKREYELGKSQESSSKHELSRNEVADVGGFHPDSKSVAPLPPTSTASLSTSPVDTRYAAANVHGHFAPVYAMQQPSEQHNGVNGQSYQTVQDYGHNVHYTNTMLPPVGATTHYAHA